VMYPSKQAMLNIHCPLARYLVLAEKAVHISQVHGGPRLLFKISQVILSHASRTSRLVLGQRRKRS
jgi:hypothetical protein